MWYRHLVLWLRSLVGLSPAPAPSVPPQPRTPTLPLTAPLRPPQIPFDGAPLPPPEIPSRRDPPTTVPLARRAGSSQPLSGTPQTGDNLGSLHMLLPGRDGAVPSQPAQPPTPSRSSPISQPLGAGFEQAESEWLEPIFEAGDADEVDIVPGSPLYRRLMMLRRLVRQGVYNEGFQSGALPEQYQHYADADGSDNPFYGE